MFPEHTTVTCPQGWRRGRRGRTPSPASALTSTLAAAAIVAGALLGSACDADRNIGGPPVPDLVSPSLHPQVKFKRSQRLQNDIARTLDIAPSQVCNELGLYSCTDEVHRVTLGGVSAYDLGLFEPLPTTALTTPLAVERVAMAACVTRVDRDLGADIGNGTGNGTGGGDGDGGALIFKDLDIDERGRLADVQDRTVATAIDTLYKRALQRRASAGEIAHLRRLYRDIESRAAAQPARDWAVLSCFAVLTTMEQLFY